MCNSWRGEWTTRYWELKGSEDGAEEEWEE